MYFLQHLLMLNILLPFLHLHMYIVYNRFHLHDFYNNMLHRQMESSHFPLLVSYLQTYLDSKTYLLILDIPYHTHILLHLLWYFLLLLQNPLSLVYYYTHLIYILLLHTHVLSFLLYILDTTKRKHLLCLLSLLTLLLVLLWFLLSFSFTSLLSILLVYLIFTLFKRKRITLVILKIMIIDLIHLDYLNIPVVLIFLMQFD